MHRTAEVTFSTTASGSDTNRGELAVAILAILIFSAFSLYFAIRSTAFLEGDACTHYLYFRAAITEPYYFVNVWGRPFATLLYALPAHFGGRLAVRITSLLLALVIGLISQNIARRQGWRWPVLALIFTLAQPLVFLHSFSELTELPFALLAAMGFWAYQRRWFFCMAVIVGLTPLSRPEGFAFVAVGALALLLHRRGWMLIVLLAPVVLWDYLGWRMYGEPGPWWHWLQANWPYDKRSLYTPGSLFYFVQMLPAIVSPIIFPATMVGMAVCIFANRNRPIRESSSDDRHRARCNVLIALLPLAVLAGHSFLYWRGAMSSNGEVRYMLVVAPFWALLSARGWSWVFQTFNWKHPLIWAAIAAMLPMGVNKAYKVLPVVNMPDWVEAEQIAHWYSTRPPSKQYPYLATAHPGILYWLGISPTSPIIKEWRKDLIDSNPPPPGTILIWDRIGAMFNSDAQRTIPLDELIKAGWQPMDPAEVPIHGGAGQWHFFKSAPLMLNETRRH
jgi:hypothetical protein